MKGIQFLALLLGLLCFGPGAGHSGEISPGLGRMIQDLEPDDTVKVLVVMRTQPDIQALNQSLREERASLPVRHMAVISELRQAAQASQGDLLDELELRALTGDVKGYTPHWLVNGVVMVATVRQVKSLAARPDVLRIEPDLQVQLVDPVLVKPAEPRSDQMGVLTTPGLQAIQATRVWTELGIDGTGSIVANMDSGVDGTHPALASRWRGNFVPAQHAWRDFASLGSANFPIDLNGHGTHTMGTIAGSTAFEKIGVAPGSQWIATNAVAAAGPVFDNAVLSAFEWLADPDGNPATVDDIPDVVQNSWGVRPEIGPYLDCDSIWWDVIDNCEAAGVVVVFSAGNEGPGPATLNSPGDRATSPTNCFSVGSTTTASPYALSYFSSRGPSECGGAYAMKPEVTAPGQDILSSFPGGGYAYLSGTSMAGPHVAGVVALMRQANPDVDVTTIKEILMETALDLGVPGEDNDYGHGIIDAYAAVLMVMTDVGSISGTITDAGTGLPLEGVHIRDTAGATESTTASDGAYGFTMRAGDTQFAISKFGYQEQILSAHIPAGGALSADVMLEPAPWSRIFGVVYGPDGLPLEGATVTVRNAPVAPVDADVNGAYEFTLPAGPAVGYELKATAPGLAYDLRETGLQLDVAIDFTLPLIQGDGFESGALDALPWQNESPAPWFADSAQAEEGAYSARSGVIAHGEDTVLGLDYYVNGEGEFSFWLRLESEIAYDRLTFRIDGNVEGTWSGQVPWTRFVKHLESGLYEFTWTYSKDGSVSVPGDAVWIDRVTLPGTGVQPFPTIDLDADQYSFASSVDAIDTFFVPLGNTGSLGLDYWIEATDPETGQVPAWGDLDPMAGTILPANRQTLRFTVDGYRAGAGLSVAELTIHSNDPASPATTVRLETQVAGVTATEPAAARQVALLGAMPNPFNPVTEILYVLPQRGEVTLRIYDTAGRLILTLVEGFRDAGEHRARWDGRDARRRPIAAGVYFARLQAAGVVQTRSLTLIK